MPGEETFRQRKLGEILKNPEACRRLMDTFNDSLDMADALDAPAVSAQQFAAALFNACLLYTSRCV